FPGWTMSRPGSIRPSRTMPIGKGRKGNLHSVPKWRCTAITSINWNPKYCLNLNIRKFAAIDIGSNALRLLISNVIEQENRPTVFKKSELVRVPVRLGEDAFLRQEISERNIKRLVQTMRAFDLLMQVYGVRSEERRVGKGDGCGAV